MPGLIAIGRALDADPYALDLRMNLMALLIETGHDKEAADQARLVHAYAPLAVIAVKVVLSK